MLHLHHPRPGVSLNVDTAKEVGEMILTSMAQQNVLQHSFKKKDHVVTLSTSAVKVNNETILIDPQLLFQRLIASGTRNDQLEEIFQFELCSHPPAIFEARYVMRHANKLHLQMLSGRWCLNTLLGQLDKASMYWMAGPWWTEYRGSGAQPTMTS